MSDKTLKPNKMALWIFGTIMIFVVLFVFSIVTFLGIISLWGLLGIPISSLIIILIILLISNGHIVLKPQGIEVKNGNEPPIYIQTNDIRRIYRDYKDLTTYVGETAKTATEIVLVFEMKDGQLVKVNDQIYTAKARNELSEYLKLKGLTIVEK